MRGCARRTHEAPRLRARRRHLRSRSASDVSHARARVAVWALRGIVMGPVTVKVPVVGSYSSASLRRAKPPLAPKVPPAIRTFPVGSSVAEPGVE